MARKIAIHFDVEDGDEMKVFSSITAELERLREENLIGNWLWDSQVDENDPRPEN